MSPTDPGASLLQLALGDLEHELSLTRRTLERVPDEHFDWRPHEKSWKLGDLAAHVANLVYWQLVTARDDSFDLASPPPASNRRAGSRDELLRTFDEHVAALREVLAGLDDDALGRTWTLFHEEHVVLRQPRLAVLRTFGISHMVHHRAQLGVYLRLLDVPVPSIYGPSADEAPGT